MTTATKEEQRVKLEALVEILKERGVVDIKFDFVQGACFDDLLHDTIQVLQAVVDGRRTLLTSNCCNDSVRLCG